MSPRKSGAFYGVLIAFVSVVAGIVIASKLDLAPLSIASNLNIPATNSAPLAGPIDSTTFRTIAHDASPSVVSIEVTMSRNVADESGFFGFDLPFPFGQNQNPGTPRNRAPQQTPRTVPQRGAGSGFIIDKAGYILTNNHVVENATSIEVHLSTMRDGEEGLPAKVIGRDELSDVALIQLTEAPRQALPEAKFGDSDQMAPGDWVMAIGSPFQLTNTVTVGVVSAVGRHNQVSRSRYEDFIQTDAAINQGNSGGPLLNVRGEVIGINSMIYSNNGGGNVGVGFSIPINTVKELLPQLRGGKVTRGRIGVVINSQTLSAEDRSDLGLPATGGAVVRSVESGGPASTAGVAAGDVIVEFNGKPVGSSDELVGIVTRTAPNTTVPMKVVRDRRTVTLNVKVEELDLAQENGQRAAAPEASPNGQAPKDTGFGMSIDNLTAAELRAARVPAGRGGVVVSEVTPFGAAAQADVQPEDVILSVQGQAVRTVDDVTRALNAVPAGRAARLIVWRDGAENLVIMRKR